MPPSGKDGHQMVPRFHLWESGDSFYPWAVEVWRFKKQCAVSVYGVYFR